MQVQGTAISPAARKLYDELSRRKSRRFPARLVSITGESRFVKALAEPEPMRPEHNKKMSRLPGKPDRAEKGGECRSVCRPAEPAHLPDLFLWNLHRRDRRDGWEGSP